MLVAGLPQTSQPWSADATAEDAGADTGTDADASGEGGVGEGVAWDVAEVDGTVAALEGCPSFFFVMVGCWGLLEV